MRETGKFVESYRDLDVYKKAYNLSLDVHKFTLTMPKIEQFALADQMRRASKSICANLAEGFAKHWRSAAEFKRFIVMAIGSSDEMVVWIDYCRDLGYLPKEMAERWPAEYVSVAKMLHALYSRWKDHG